MRGYHLFNAWMEQCQSNLDLEVLDIYIGLKAIGKGRPRSGHSTPILTRTWTDYIAICIAEVMDHRPAITFPVNAKILFGLSGKRQADTDNMEKAVWDAMQRGDKSGKHRAIEDDRLIRGHVEKGEIIVPKGEEFTWVRFYAQTAEDRDKYEESCDGLQPSVTFSY